MKDINRCPYVVRTHSGPGALGGQARCQRPDAHKERKCRAVMVGPKWSINDPDLDEETLVNVYWEGRIRAVRR